jgi:ABC-2 type transport system permease protein
VSAISAADVGRVAGRNAMYLARAWRLELRQLLRSKLYLFLAVAMPVIFATLAFSMFDGSSRTDTRLSLALSAGLMGMWSTTLMGSGASINRLRYLKVLEPLVASPRSTFLFTLPFALATSALGCYSLAATLLWGYLLYGVPLHVASPALFVLAVGVAVLAVGLTGLLLGTAFILYPTAQSLANLFEYPIWMLSGMLVPVSALPGPLHALSYGLAPAWGVKAVLGAASGASDTTTAMATCLLLAAVYTVLIMLLLRRFEWLARSSGTLSLQ